MNDVFIDDVPKEFPELIKFVELLTLLYRTLGSHYRPHKGRIIDENYLPIYKIGILWLIIHG